MEATVRQCHKQITIMEATVGSVSWTNHQHEGNSWVPTDQCHKQSTDMEGTDSRPHGSGSPAIHQHGGNSGSAWQTNHQNGGNRWAPWFVSQATIGSPQVRVTSKSLTWKEPPSLHGLTVTNKSLTWKQQSGPHQPVLQANQRHEGNSVVPIGQPHR